MADRSRYIADTSGSAAITSIAYPDRTSDTCQNLSGMALGRRNRPRSAAATVIRGTVDVASRSSNRWAASSSFVEVLGQARPGVLGGGVEAVSSKIRQCRRIGSRTSSRWTRRS